MKTAIVILLTSVICINKGNSQAVVNAQAGERRDDYDYTGVDCLGDELPCADGENCFRKSKLCDGVYNCLDRSDESNCTSDSTTQSANVTTQAPIVTTLAPTTTTEDDYGAYGGCASGLFDCGDDLCIMTSQRCDGKYDCPDWKDEDGCPNTTAAATSTAVATTTVPDYDGCEANEFQCGNDVCISTGVRCDGRDDCGDFTDEQNCPTSPASTAQASTSAGTTEPPDYDACAADEFECVADGVCIELRLKCDNRSDCSDNSDEVNCQPEVTTPQTTPTTMGTTFTPRPIVGPTCVYNNTVYTAGSTILSDNCTEITCSSSGRLLTWNNPDPVHCNASLVTPIITSYLFLVMCTILWGF